MVRKRLQAIYTFSKIAARSYAVEYIFTVTNTGNAALSNVSVSDPLLGGPGAGPASGDTNSKGALDTTETQTYTASYSILQADIESGQVNNLATVKGDEPNGNAINDTSISYRYKK